MEYRTYLVEHYRPGVHAEELREAAARLYDVAADLGNAGAEIRHLHSTIVPEDEAFLSVFEATSEDLVREAHERAGLQFERISVAISMFARQQRKEQP